MHDGFPRAGTSLVCSGITRFAANLEIQNNEEELKFPSYRAYDMISFAIKFLPFQGSNTQILVILDNDNVGAFKE